MTPGTDFDQIVVNGTVNITGADLILENISGTAEDSCETVVLIDNDGTDPIIGTFSGIAEGAAVDIGGISGKVSYIGGDGNDLSLVLDAEPPMAVCQDITVQLDASGNASILAADIDGGSTDNCGIALLSVSPSSFTCADVGPNTVTLTVTDVNGNSASCTAVVTVEDNIPPVITCVADPTVDTDPGVCTYTVQGSEFDATFTDNCTSATLTNDYNGAATLDGEVLPQGTTTVVWTVDDGNGQSATCTTVITVEDNEAPMIFCPADIVAETNNGNCGATVTFVLPVATDNCGIDQIIQQAGIASGGVFPVGVTTNQFAVIDVNGNVSFCSFDVTVTDTSAPLAVCQDITVALDATGNATIVPADVDGGSSDNCAIDTLSIDINSFTCADLGDNPVVLTVTDTSGNVASCTAIVTVVNGTEPVAVCQDVTLQLDAMGMVVVTDASIFDGGSTDACGNTGQLSFSVSPSSFGCGDVGDNPVTLTVTDASGNVSTCTAIATVEDTINPTVSCMDLTVSLDENGEASITAGDLVVFSDDNCGVVTTTASITEFDCDDVGNPIAVTITVEDASGNMSSCTATVTVLDEIDPVIDCPTEVVVQAMAGGQYQVENFVTSGLVTATDNCSDPVNVVIQTPAIGSLLDPGTYPASITVSDASGNGAVCTFDLIVEEEVLGTESFDISSLSMYPNPATDHVVLGNPQTIPLKDVAIYD
ncbi:MAG: HYR domain-containing protein, partial [Saprospiraceae bacterium]|nr:HYR domain-containing protein [Saprospiraceae bacterium]